jgi:flagellar biosynthesis protein FlhF
MTMLSYLGETPTVALRNATRECGDDALVVSTKQISKDGPDSVNMYEVIVAVEDDAKINIIDPISHKVKQKEIAQRKVKQKIALATKQANINKSNINQSNFNQANAPKNNISIPTQEIKTVNEEVKLNVYDFQKDILNMQKSIETVQKTLWEPKSTLYDLVIPHEFIDIYNKFEQNEFDSEMIYTIMKKTIEQLPLALKANPNKIDNFFRLILKKLIPIKVERPVQKNRQNIMMFVGPTGVGKTTTVAKLAARFAYKLKNGYKVGVITLDTFRVGAVEQLSAYTKIMRISLETVKTPDGLERAIEKLRYCHYILIDTAGSSQFDIEKIEHIANITNGNDDIKISKYLVLPSNVKYNDLFDIYDNFSDKINIDSFIFTKLDETKSFGNLISFVYKIKKPISYLSVGQMVPDDLHIADSKYIIDSFFNQKFKKSSI